MDGVPGPKPGDRVRYRSYGAVWNRRRGRAGERGTVSEVVEAGEGRHRVVVAPDEGGITDTVLECRAGGWPRALERDPAAGSRRD